MPAVKMTRNAWIAIAVVAVLLVGAGAWALWGRDTGTTTGPQATNSSNSSESTRTTPGKPSSAATGTSAPTTSGGTTGGNATRPQGTGGTGGTPTTKPLQPAPEGQQLKQIMQAPESTMWAFKPDTYQEGTRIALQFQPYGIGPSSLGESVVVRVSSARPVEAGANIPELAQRNVVLVLGNTAVKVGGSYRGVGVITVRGDRACIVLSEAELTK